MAITAPTPPTPPTAPVVPGGRISTSSDTSSTDAVQQNAGTTGAGEDKGIHININLPEREGNQHKQENIDNTGSNGNGSNMGTAKKTISSQEKSQADQQTGKDDAADKTAQQARQDMVQQALGSDEGNTQEQQEIGQQPWPLPGNNLGIMSYMPFLIVFVAAFITFMLKNMSKKPARGTRKNISHQTRQRHSSEELHGSQGHIDIANGAGAKASAKDAGKKGSHFEMRI